MNYKLSDQFALKSGDTAKITEIFSIGLNYHTIDSSGNCIKSQQYSTKSNFKSIIGDE